MAKDAETKALALEYLRQGMTHVEIARIAGIDPRTVRRWATAAEKEVARKPITHEEMLRPAPSPLPDFDIDENAPVGVGARKLWNANLKRVHQAMLTGDGRTEQQSSAVLSKMVPGMIKIEEALRADADGVHVTAAELAEAQDFVRARLAAIAERPLLCANCSRALSIEWGTAAPPTETPEKEQEK